MLIRDQRIIKSIDTCEKRTRLDFLRNSMSLIQGDSNLTRRDLALARKDDLHFHLRQISFAPFANPKDRHNNLLQAGAAMHETRACALPAEPIDGIGNQHIHIARQAQLF